MSMKFRLPCPAVVSPLRRAGPIAAVLMAALVLVPSAASGNYTDPAGDSGAAGDIISVTVVGDKSSGQLVFRITGSNLATGFENPLWLSIDSDSNPLTGDLTDHGTDFWFGVGGHTYGFQRWNGSDWIDTPYATVHVTSSTNQVMISVNRSELGNAAALNFIASTFSGPTASTSGIILAPGADLAPNDGAYNYSFETNGPQINSVDVQTTPSAGPRVGKRFVILPTALKLPPDGRTTATPVLPESYSCTVKLAAKQLAGSGTGGCTVVVPKKKVRGKRLTVQLTVNYQGATKVVPLTFKVT